MAITLDHTEGNALSFDDGSPAKGVTGWAPIDAGAGSYFEYVNIQLVLSWDANGDGDATLKRRISADSETVTSDTSLDIGDVAYNTSGSRTLTIQLTKFNYASIGIYNGTSTECELTITGKWEGLKVTDA